jgi:hypothetical protein
VRVFDPVGLVGDLLEVEGDAGCGLLGSVVSLEGQKQGVVVCWV